MKRIVVLMSAAALTGCGNVESNAPADDGDDIGCVADAECGESEVCNSETQQCEVPDGLAIQLNPTTFYDERGDHIAFATGEPVHTHAGEAVTLGGADCPAVYKYSYLLGPATAPYGKEATSNPIAWKFRAIGGLVTDAEFRVRSADGTEIDWTPAAAGSDGTFGVEIHRTGRNGFPKLEVVTRQYFIDFRVRDEQQHEAIHSACWEHHPLSAPVSISGLVPSTAYDGLMDMSVKYESHLSFLTNNESLVSVMEARLVNQTTEPARVRLEIPKPVVEYSKTYVTDWLAGPGTTGPLDCGHTCDSSSPTCVEREPQDVRCRVADPAVVKTDTGTLGTGKWTITVRDAQTKQPVEDCVVDTSGGAVVCELPGRMLDRPAKELLVLTQVNQITNLKPYLSATMGEIYWSTQYTSGIYTGVTNVNQQFVGCIEMLISLPNQNGEIWHQCRQYGTITKFVGIDNLELDIAAPTMTVSTRNAGEMSTPPYHPTGQIAGESFVWDSGNENLPGSY